MQASLQDAHPDAEHNHEVRIVYLDGDGLTDDIEISVIADDGTELRPTTTEEIDGTGPYVETFPITEPFDPDAQSASVTVEAERDFDIETYEAQIGAVPDVFTTLPVPGDVMWLMGIVSLISLVGLLVIVEPPMAALVGSGYAGLLSITGVVDIPMTAVVLAGVVSIAAVVGTDRGVLR